MNSSSTSADSNVTLQCSDHSLFLLSIQKEAIFIHGNTLDKIVFQVNTNCYLNRFKEGKEQDLVLYKKRKKRVYLRLGLTMQYICIFL